MQYTEGYLLDHRYRLDRFVGSGTYGEVWVATDKGIDLEVAIKIYVSMDDQGLQDFKKEFQITFDFNQTNLLHANYLGVNEEDKRPYLVMPFCPDGSVSKYAGQLPEKDIWRFIRDVAAGLAYLHSQDPPVIHQDIKPDNILIQKNGDFVITDFGISTHLRRTLSKSSMQLKTAGSISYMGPERFSKQYQAVKASDIWSVGASIYELAVGDVPFCGMGGGLQKQGADMPELPEDEFSPKLNMIMQACLAREPWNRPTAAQLTEYADRYLKGENPSVKWGKKNQASPAQSNTQPITPPQPGEIPGQGYNQPFQGQAPQQMYPGQQAPYYQPGQYVPQYPPQGYPGQAPFPSRYPAQGIQQSSAPQMQAGKAADKKEESIPGWLWGVIAAAGLLAGFLLHLFV